MMPIPPSERLSKLRQLMKAREIDAYVVPTEDAHASEYLAPCDERRHYISGFLGSAGLAVVTATEARCWTDGRYYLQAEKELSTEWILMKAGLPETPLWTKWVTTDLPSSSKIGIDPMVLSYSEAKNLTAALETAKQSTSLVPVKENLIDAIWSGRPSSPCNNVFRLDDKYTGESIASKLTHLREKMAASGSPGIVVCHLDEVAWMFNLRGSDIPFNPVFFAYAILTPDDCTLFTDTSRLDVEVKDHLNKNGVAVMEYARIWNALEAWNETLRKARGEYKAATPRTPEEPDGSKKVPPTFKVTISGKTSWAVAKALGEENLDVGRSLVEDAKAKKNAVEMEGFRQCNIRDGAALVRYFAWLEEALSRREIWNEHEAAMVLGRYRKEGKHFMGLSFPAISSTGSNAAVIHYFPPEEGSAVIQQDQVYLCDSGAQYLDGTTDTTRTVHFGQPKPDEKRAFTRVLQGHIAIDTLVFPQGTTGYVIDPLARQFLWSDGLDYRHGTGHGVGSFLNVHEGPQGIGLRPTYNDTPFQAGHVTSIEPGYYKDGEFGIRIENVAGVKISETRWNFGNKGYLEMEHFTQVPIQTKMVELSLLSAKERQWLNDYNAEVLEKVTPLLQEYKDDRALRWLEKECVAV